MWGFLRCEIEASSSGILQTARSMKLKLGIAYLFTELKLLQRGNSPVDTRTRIF